MRRRKNERLLLLYHLLSVSSGAGGVSGRTRCSDGRVGGPARHTVVQRNGSSAEAAEDDEVRGRDPRDKRVARRRLVFIGQIKGVT